MPELRKTTQLTYKTYRSALLRVLSQKRALWLVPVMIGFVIVTSFLGGPKEGRDASSALMSVGFVIVGLVIAALLISRRFKRTFEKSPQLSEPVDYYFTEERIEGSSPAVDWAHRWDAFVKVTEIPGAMLLYQTTVVVNIVPTNEFTAQELTTLRDIIRAVPDLRYKLLD